MTIVEPISPRNQYKVLQLPHRASSIYAVNGTHDYRRISSSTYQNHKTPIMIGAVTGSLLSLLIIFGGGTFLYIRKRRHRNFKHRLSPNLKIKPELNSYSPPVGNQNGETITPMVAGGLTPDFEDRSQETVEQGPAGNLTKEEVERRNSISSPAHVDTSEPQRAPQEEGPQAALGGVVAEVVRLRTQFHQFINIVEQEAGRVHGHALDPPPPYT